MRKKLTLKRGDIYAAYDIYLRISYPDPLRLGVLHEPYCRGEVIQMKKLMAVLIAICEGVILAVEIFKNDISKGN